MKNNIVYSNGMEVICSSCNCNIYVKPTFSYKCLCGSLIYVPKFNNFQYKLNKFCFNYDTETYITNDYSFYYVFNDYCFLNKSNNELLDKLKIFILL